MAGRRIPATVMKLDGDPAPITVLEPRETVRAKVEETATDGFLVLSVGGWSRDIALGRIVWYEPSAEKCVHGRELDRSCSQCDHETASAPREGNA